MHLLKAMQNKLKLWFIEGKFNEENDMKLVLTIWLNVLSIFYQHSCIIEEANAAIQLKRKIFMGNGSNR